MLIDHTFFSLDILYEQRYNFFIERLRDTKEERKRCSEKNMWKEYTEIQQKELEELSVRYKECLDIGKTERECVKLGKKMADAWGYKNLEDCISEGTT